MLTAIILTIYHVTRHEGVPLFRPERRRAGTRQQESSGGKSEEMDTAVTPFEFSRKKASHREIRLTEGTRDVPPGFRRPDQR